MNFKSADDQEKTLELSETEVLGHEIKLKKPEGGVPVVAQRKRIQLGTTRLQVESLALLSGLKICRCCELWCRSLTRLRSRVAVAVVVA